MLLLLRGMWKCRRKLLCTQTQGAKQRNIREKGNGQWPAKEKGNAIAQGEVPIDTGQLESVIPKDNCGDDRMTEQSMQTVGQRALFYQTVEHEISCVEYKRSKYLFEE